MHALYTLTPLTGREASAARTVVIGTVEFNWRVWMILISASPVAVIVTIVAWIFVAEYALIMLPAVEIGALWLIHRRTKDGLRLRTYQAIRDKRKSSLNEFFICGRRIDLDAETFRTLMHNTVPVRPATKAPPTALVDLAVPAQAPSSFAPVAAAPTPAPETPRRTAPDVQVLDTPPVTAPAPAPVTPSRAPAPVPAVAPSAAPGNGLRMVPTDNPNPVFDETDDIGAWFDFDSPAMATPTWKVS